VVIVVTSPPRGGHQKGWTEDEDIHIGSVWLEFEEIAKREKKMSGMSNSAIAAGVHQMLAVRGGLGADKNKKQLEEWYQRKKQLHKKIKEKKGTSGAKRPIAQKGEKVKKGMVSSVMWNLLRSMFGGDIAVVPPKEILGSAGGGMSEAEAKAAVAEQKEATKKRPSAKMSGRKKKPRHTETDDALSADGSNSSDSEESDDSVEEIMRHVETAQYFYGKDGNELEDEDKEAIQVFHDDDVDLDAAASKPPSLTGDLEGLRSKARFKTSMNPAGNKIDRQRMHQMSSSHAAFQSACNSITSSCRASDFSAQELLKEINALKELKEVGFYNETEFKEKVQELKNKQEAGSGKKVDQRAKKKKKSAAAAEAAKHSAEEEEEEEGEVGE